MVAGTEGARRRVTVREVRAVRAVRVRVRVRVRFRVRVRVRVRVRTGRGGGVLCWWRRQRRKVKLAQIVRK